MQTTILNCSQKSAFFIFSLIGILFILAGCAQVYKALGLTEEQTQEQVSEDQKTIIRTVNQVRTTTAEILTTALAGLGTIASGFLAKWLGTERKITKALIAGIEKSAPGSVKESVHQQATNAGIEPQLSKRVAALT